jgi:hypothetical protein
MFQFLKNLFTPKTRYMHRLPEGGAWLYGITETDTPPSEDLREVRDLFASEASAMSYLESEKKYVKLVNPTEHML